jgi:hypothetical protein
MKLSDVKLPNNRSFGLLFSVIFLIFSVFLLVNNISFLGLAILLLAIIFILISIIKPNILLPLNKAWMQFGMILGMIISPIVLGVIFFGLFTLYSLIMKLFGRDELRIKIIERSSHWKNRNKDESRPIEFKHQF